MILSKSSIYTLARLDALDYYQHKIRSMPKRYDLQWMHDLYEGYFWLNFDEFCKDDE